MNSANFGNSADAEHHARLDNSSPDVRVNACGQDERSENSCGRSVPGAFTVIPGDEESPVVIHVPHSSCLIPPGIRADLLLSDQKLADELDEATDTGTDEIVLTALAHVRLRPTIVINHLSRLVIDPERFPDDDPAEAFGRGAVYTRTCTGPRCAPNPIHGGRN